MKYVDNGTMCEVCTRDSVGSLQASVDVAAEWSKENSMRINPDKTKEMVICFCKDRGHSDALLNLVINDSIVERVQSSKILGVIVSKDLSWNQHIEGIITKASKRLYVLVQKRAIRTIYPGVSYLDTTEKSNMQTLFDRREELCNKYFTALKRQDHKLHHLLPPSRNVPYPLRYAAPLVLPKIKIQRYFNSLMTWGIRNDTNA